jgi:hypothetical protein
MCLVITGVSKYCQQAFRKSDINKTKSAYPFVQAAAVNAENMV